MANTGWHRARVEPTFDDSGKAARWYGWLTYVDDQRKAEQALRTREHQLQQIADAIPTLIWSAHPDGSSEFLNARWLEYTGLSQEQAKGWGWDRTADVASGRPGTASRLLADAFGVRRAG